jgi:hypothetical protein
MLTTTGLTVLTAITTALSRRLTAPRLSGALKTSIIETIQKTTAEINTLLLCCVVIFGILNTVIIILKFTP